MKIKKDDIFIYASIGGILAYAIFRRPVTSAIWDLHTNQAFYANLKELIQKNDPAAIRRLRDKYENSGEIVQEKIDEAIKSMNLKRPW